MVIFRDSVPSSPVIRPDELVAVHGSLQLLFAAASVAAAVLAFKRVRSAEPILVKLRADKRNKGERRLAIELFSNPRLREAKPLRKKLPHETSRRAKVLGKPKFYEGQSPF